MEERTEVDVTGLDPDTIYLCMGSACHHKGVYDVLPKLRELLDKYCGDDVPLKGSFCLGPCTEGILIYYNGYLATGIMPDNIEKVFLSELLVLIDDRQQHG